MAPKAAFDRFHRLLIPFISAIQLQIVMTATLASAADIARLYHQQRQHQPVVARSVYRERVKKLERLHEAVLKHADLIHDALYKDFRKGITETDISEIGVVTTEIRHVIRNLRTWMQPQQVSTPIALMGSRSEVRRKPKGVSLIIAPWNYPVQLGLMPLISAVAAGNCAIIKPSEFTPYSSAALRAVVESCFTPEEVAVVEGDASVAQELMQYPFDHIFFTGSPTVGKIIMAGAAKHLSSVTLELGGKSPVIVDETANIDVAAAKIAWIKAMNAGQICIAPDYVLVQESVHDALVQKIGEKWEQFYGKTPEARQKTADLCRIIHERHFERIVALIEDGMQKGAQLRFGGRHSKSDLYVEPTLLTDIGEDMQIMHEEIFGPVLPVQKFKTLEQAISIVNSRHRPLAMYIFSTHRKKINLILNETTSGNVTVNDCAAHYFNVALPFGGIGNSGIGKSHGEAGFLEFTHSCGILHQNRFLRTTDYFLPPYGGRLAKWMLEGVKRFF